MNSISGIIGLICVLFICVVFLAVIISGILLGQRWLEAMAGKNGPQARKALTPTQKFILAASSPTVCNNFKCVIDIWDTHKSDMGRDRAKQLFEWGWGEFTYENARNMADDCLNRGYHMKFKEYCSVDASSSELASKYTDFELRILKETKAKYPKQGMLGWDLVRVLSIVGGAYMGGIMEYREAAEIALKACRLCRKGQIKMRYVTLQSLCSF